MRRSYPKTVRRPLPSGCRGDLETADGKGLRCSNFAGAPRSPRARPAQSRHSCGGRGHGTCGAPIARQECESAFFHKIRRVFPGLAPWTEFCYRDASQLLLDDRRLRSDRGIQQGDPLGPALFALAIHEAILEAMVASGAGAPGGLDLCMFFLDDGTNAGTAEAVHLFMRAFTRKMEERGLTLAVAKCE
eukprot:9910030-Heterocapsa_arctica.AAC.1